MRSTGIAGFMLALAPLAAPAALAAPSACGSEAEASMSEGRFLAAATAFERAAVLPECAAEADRLHFNAAFALHEHARHSNDATWCRARDAYAALDAAADPELASAAAEGARIAGQSCAVFVQGVSDGMSVGVGHWWLTGTGLGLVAAGAVMAGFGVDAYLTASDLDATLRESGQGESDDAVRQRRAEGGALALFIGAGALSGAGVLLLAVGVAMAGQPPGEVGAAQVEVSLGGARLTVSF